MDIHPSLCGKRKYENESEAVDTAVYQMAVGKAVQLRVYKCKICIGWHLTSKTFDERKRRKRQAL